MIVAPRLAHMKPISDIGTLCKYERDTLNGPETISNDEYSQLVHEPKLTNLEKDLVDVAVKVCSLAAERNKNKAELIHFTERLAGQKEEIKNLEAELESTRAAVESLHNNIFDERARQNSALYDSIPFCGLFAGITSEDWKHAIPFYSLFIGLRSFLTVNLVGEEKREQKREEEMTELQQKLENAKSAIEKTEQSIADLKADIAKKNKQVLIYDNESKHISQKISAIHDARVRLGTPALKMDIQNIMELKDNSFIKNYIANFHQLQSASG